MTGTKIHNPNDALFKASLSHPEVADEFLKLYLPGSIKKDIDFKTVELCQTTFIDKQLHHAHSDVLFKAMIAGKESYLYILSEHQSTVDKLMPYRLFQYMMCIWNFHIKQSGKKNSLPLPLIFPLVFYTGHAPYNGFRNLWELFGDNEEAMQKILQSPLHLIDVNTLSEEELTENVWAGTLGFILRKQFKKNLPGELIKIAANLNTIGLEKQGAYLVELVHYIFDIEDDRVSVHDLISIMHDKLSPDVEDKIMSLAEKLRLEGELNKSLEIAQNMLAEGSNPVFVAKVTRLPLNKIKELQKK